MTRAARWHRAAIRPLASGALAAAVERPRHVLLGAAVCGLIVGPRSPTAALAIAIELAVVALATGARWRANVALLGAALALVAGATGAELRLAALDRTTLRPWIGHAAGIVVVVLEAPRPRSFGQQAALVEIQSGPGAGERVLVRSGRMPVEVGELARVQGGFRALPLYESAARRRGAHALVDADAVVSTGERRDGVAGALDGIRRRAERALSQGLPPPLAGLARGMVLGEGHALPPAMADDFQTVGLTHLVAASGANVALLAALVLGLAALTGLPLRSRLWLTLGAIAAYVPLAGGGPSIQRAGVMGAATVVAALASSAASRWYGLLLAAAVTLAANPRAAEDPGWQMSFAAVVALIVLAPPLRRRLSRRMARPVAEAAAVAVAAGFGTAPLIALHFGRISLVSLPANLVAAPAVPAVMWLGALAALAGQASPALAAPLTALAAWPLAFLAWLAAAAAAVPGAEVAAPPLVPVIAGCAALAAGIAAYMVLRRPGARGRPSRSRRRAMASAIGLLAAAACAIAALERGSGRAMPSPGLVISALDVGQGDATLIQHGRHAILVDAGPPDGPILRRLHESGVTRLDALVVTHAQADHEGGAAAVLGAMPVRVVLDGRDGVRSYEGARFATIATRRRIRLVRPTAGLMLRAGPLVFDVLSPRPEDPSVHAGEDPNERAVVAELRDGAFSMLLTADAESEVLATLPLEQVDVLKVSHHGSADDGLPRLLARLRPAVALIEVGRNNRYGHPAPSTLTALDAVPRVLRTDRDGTVRLRVSAHGIVVEGRT